MDKIIIWHNSRCSKSNETLKILKDKNFVIDIVNYLETPPSTDEIKKVLDLLGISAKELIRKSEEAYETLNLENINDEYELIKIMNKNPQLIQRPIVIKSEKAVIPRPLEKLEEIFK